MEQYTASIEANAPGDPEIAAERLDDALREAAPDGGYTVRLDDERGMVAIELGVEGDNAIEAHDVAIRSWSGAWDVAFPEGELPTKWAMRIVQGTVAAAAPVPAGVDPLDDLGDDAPR